MIVEVAKTAGFCFGVKRAVDLVYKESESEHVYTYGPIIHNESVVADLENKGVSVLESKEAVLAATKGTVVIRAHGVEKETYEQIQAAGHKTVDATCPFVLKIHRIVKEAVLNGEYVIIIGDAAHPEVRGIKSWAGDACTVIRTKEEVEKFLSEQKKNCQKLCIVSQTTFNYNKFQDFVEIFEKTKYYKIDVLNTICNATEERQSEAAMMARRMDAMIVIGGRNSSNTQKLYEICSKECPRTFYIQNADDMDYTKLRGLNKVGITAGASTPNNIIQEVQTRCQI